MMLSELRTEQKSEHIWKRTSCQASWSKPRKIFISIHFAFSDHIWHRKKRYNFHKYAALRIPYSQYREKVRKLFLYKFYFIFYKFYFYKIFDINDIYFVKIILFVIYSRCKLLYVLNGRNWDGQFAVVSNIISVVSSPLNLNWIEGIYWGLYHFWEVALGCDCGFL